MTRYRTRAFGRYRTLATGFFGGLASTTAAASTLAGHGQLSVSVAGDVAILYSLASALINPPISWHTG